MGQGNNTKAAPPPPKTWMTPAAHLFGGVNGDIIGDKSFLGGDIKVTLGSFKLPDLNPWIGFRIEIPRGSPDATEAAGFGVCYKVDRSHQPAGIPGVADKLVISVKFPRGTQILVEEVVGNVAGRTSPLPDALLKQNCSSVEFCLSEPAIVEGFGLPFSNPGHPSEG